MKEESLSLKNVCKKVGNEISIEKKKLEKEKKDCMHNFTLLALWKSKNLASVSQRFVFKTAGGVHKENSAAFLMHNRSRKSCN